MGDSQQTPPVQAQPGPIMRCCQRTDIRDCNCLHPRGPFQKPTFIFTHYSQQCACYSCEWIREARQQHVPDRLGSGSNPGGFCENCTYAGKQLDEVVKTESPIPNELELVHSVMVAEGPPQLWGWVFRSTHQQQLAYLASESQCPKTVEIATLDSNGRWKGIRPKEEPFPLVHNLPPKCNRLYRDYNYSPAYSPYEHSPDVARPPDNMACTPDGMVPTNRLRRHAADKRNATLVIGGIDNSVSNEELLWLFGCYGQIRYCNRPDQTCAFVQFALRRDAMMAMRQLQGIPVYRRRFRISWGDPKIRNQDDFEAREGPLRLKGNRHQKPQQPKNMEKEREEARRPQFPPNHPRHDQRPAWAFGVNSAYQNGLPHQQASAQQQMGWRDQSMPPIRPDPCAAPFTPEQKGKRQVVVVSSDCVVNQTGQSHNTQPQGTRTPSPGDLKTSGGSSPKSPDRAASGSSTSGRTSPEEEARPDEGGSK